MDDDLQFIQDTLHRVSDVICQWKNEARQKIEAYNALDENIRDKCTDAYNRIFNVYTENIERFEKEELKLRQTITDIFVKERDLIQTRTCVHAYKKSWKKR
jgi:uncharacterized protein YdcH (DUF465 family)